MSTPAALLQRCCLLGLLLISVILMKFSLSIKFAALAQTLFALTALATPNPIAGSCEYRFSTHMMSPLKNNSQHSTS